MLKYIAVSFLLLFTMACCGQGSGYAFSSDSAPVFYRTFGAGKPLLIINGGPGMNSEGFEALARKLAEHYQTIIYDQRGTGRSQLAVLDTNTITMQLMMDDIEAMRRHLKIEKWYVLGHSFGGMLASLYATQYPGRIEKMILSSSGGIDLSLQQYVQQSINSKLSQAELDSLAYWGKIVSDGDTSHYARLQRGKFLAPAYVVDKKYIPVIAERLTQGNAIVNQLVWANLNKINFDCTEKLKSFTKPVLIIQGKQDIISEETAGKALHTMPNSRLVLVEHSAHYGWLDNPEVYFQSINSFLLINGLTNDVKN